MAATAAGLVIMVIIALMGLELDMLWHVAVVRLIKLMSSLF